MPPKTEWNAENRLRFLMCILKAKGISSIPAADVAEQFGQGITANAAAKQFKVIRDIVENMEAGGNVGNDSPKAPVTPKKRKASAATPKGSAKKKGKKEDSEEENGSDENVRTETEVDEGYDEE
jgi:hypothetical protein